MHQRILILLAAVSLASGILIPLRQHHYSCMLVYSTGNGQSVKLDIHFPFVLVWDRKDYYQITLKNTKTQQVETEKVPYGRYLRELTLLEQTIYEVCFEIKAEKEIPGELLIEYYAETEFKVNRDKIRIPKNVLAVKNMEQTYQETVEIKKIITDFEAGLKTAQKEDEETFSSYKQSEMKMIILGLIELVSILGIAVYQFFVVRSQLQKL